MFEPCNLDCDVENKKTSKLALWYEKMSIFVNSYIAYKVVKSASRLQSHYKGTNFS